MNQLDQEQMGLHVTILGWIFIVGNGILLLIGCLGFMLLTGIGSIAAANSDPEALGVLGLIGTVAILFFAVLSVPGLAAGYGLLKRQTWGRILAIVVGILGLVNFPVGTAVGVYALFVLLQDAATDYFAPPASA